MKRNNFEVELEAEERLLLNIDFKDALLIDTVLNNSRSSVSRTPALARF